MTLTLVAVAGMTVDVDQGSAIPPTPPAPAPPPVVPEGIQATIVVAAPTGTKCKAESKLIHRQDDTITVTNISVPAAGATTVDPGPYVVKMVSSAQYVKAENKFVLLDGDQSETISATPKIPGTPPVDYPVSFKCVVTDANQAKVKAQ